MNDRELLAGIRQKNETCYEQLVDKYMRYVAAVIAKVAGGCLNSYDIEEICSDTFIKIWLKADKIIIRGESIKAYLAVAARNNTLNVLRDKERRKEDELDENLLIDDSTEDILLQKQEELEMNELMSALPEIDHEIIIRRYFHMEKVKDIARKLGLGDKAVSARIARSKSKLKLLFRQNEIQKKENGSIEIEGEEFRW
jgi:RNA polymerase sigma-70 factor (ECF subfamily)